MPRCLFLKSIEHYTQVSPALEGGAGAANSEFFSWVSTIWGVPFHPTLLLCLATLRIHAWSFVGSFCSVGNLRIRPSFLIKRPEPKCHQEPFVWWHIIHCLEQKPLKRRVKKKWLNYEAWKNMQTIYDLLLLAPNMAISFAWKKQSTEIHRKTCLKITLTELVVTWCVLNNGFCMRLPMESWHHHSLYIFLKWLVSRCHHSPMGTSVTDL